MSALTAAVGVRVVRRNTTHRKPFQHEAIPFNEWSSFPDLRTFNSDYLIAALTSQDEGGLPFLWSAPEMELDLKHLPTTALRQAEAVFNLSQLMFALYHGSISACTFLDLQLNQPPRDIRRYGFTKLDRCKLYSGAVFRQALHTLCWDITESGGLPVIFSMMKNPALPIIRQKCLDALTNILCVDSIEKIILERQPWFLDMLVKMVEQGDLQCDMVPAISVLDRLVVVILSERMAQPYQQLMRLNIIDVCLSRLQCPEFSGSSLHLHFVKFQTIAMQAVALLCADEQSASWPKDVQDRVFRYSFHSVLLWNTDQPPSDPIWHQSESFYRTMSFSSSALVFSFVVLVHATVRWSGKLAFMKQQALAFKYQLSKIVTLHGSLSNCQNTDMNAPIILNAVEWLWSALYSDIMHPLPTSSLCTSILDPLPELCERVLRYCSYKPCSRREAAVGEWAACPNCGITCYCSESCLADHRRNGHDRNRCDFLTMSSVQPSAACFSPISSSSFRAQQ